MITGSTALSANGAIDSWTERLLTLTPTLDRMVARTFVHDLYHAAQADLDSVKAQADLEREE